MGRQAPLVTSSVEPHEEQHKADGMAGNSQVEPATTASPAPSGAESNGIALAFTAALLMLQHKYKIFGTCIPLIPFTLSLHVACQV
jgi:hypothetical protein